MGRELVRIFDDRTVAVVVQRNSYYSEVEYSRAGVVHKAILPNDDFEEVGGEYE